MFDHCRHAGDSIAIFIRAWLTLVRDVQPPYHLTHWPTPLRKGQQEDTVRRGSASCSRRKRTTRCPEAISTGRVASRTSSWR